MALGMRIRGEGLGLIESLGCRVQFLGFGVPSLGLRK